MHGVLYYLDWRVAIQEIRRVLKPKGLLYFVETNGSNPILNIYRRIRHSLTGYRDEQTTRHLIHKKQFIEISKNFSSCRIHFDDLCVLLCGFPLFKNRSMYRFFASLDSILLTLFKVLTFKVSLVAKKH